MHVRFGMMTHLVFNKPVNEMARHMIGAAFEEKLKAGQFDVGYYSPSDRDVFIAIGQEDTGLLNEQRAYDEILGNPAALHLLGNYGFNQKSRGKLGSEIANARIIEVNVP